MSLRVALREIESRLSAREFMANHSPRFLQIVDAVRVNIRECTVNEIQDRLKRGEQFLLFDVREESEYAAGHLPTAKWLGKGIIERDIESIVPDPDTEMVLYCGGGFRSALAADNLQKMGYTNIISMDGGFRGWKESGSEIVK
jgi:rhodanese-related sulfurtransferase